MTRLEEKKLQLQEVIDRINEYANAIKHLETVGYKLQGQIELLQEDTPIETKES